jgi:hypothetical protein
MIARACAARRGTATAMAMATAVAACALLLLLDRAARASLTIARDPGVDGCVEADSYFPEDESDEAVQARRRCRLENFDRRLDEDQRRKAAAREQTQEQALETWMQKQQIPSRVFRRNSIDVYGSGGLTSYGLAVGGVLVPWLEGELWIGRRSVSDLVDAGYLVDSRSCFGGRLKWLMLSRGNLTPFVSLGAALCSASLQLNPNIIAAVGGNGEGSAHLATATGGAAWMSQSGVRVSFEYFFAKAFYTQATRDDPDRPLDDNLRAAWQQRLTSDGSGVRLQVGYAF